MNLTLKQPIGKPPFIGVVFDSQYIGAKFNAEMVEELGDKEFRVEMELQDAKLLIRLICTEGNEVFVYPNVGFQPEKLMAWLYKTQGAKLINFGHVYSVFDEHRLIISPHKKKKFVVRLSGIDFRKEE